ncbi:MAG: division/cell wall cluster transcriptional repressor MraZ [Thermoflavifilum sp.]|uniref:division/cell wall cluster transcriptional repressor MraZ n=1 Tax=Thermoflavifilum sp. TaxID=1968839 RepID=UPI0018A3A2D9|nr:division/cell wall cluster transcriptional repressor MraZ [Thermoflavifilum sp.]QOR75162.1 MAG: division/cell wall cluster transcriptional repressor MraZ [Thermoflavifilum sp.]
MTGFLGEYEATLDAKGRFLLPTGFRKQLGEGDSHQFVLNRGFEKCLSLYPMSEWMPLFEQLKKLNDFDPQVRAFKRYFLAGATLVELDSASRILLPRHLMEYAGLTRDIILAANTNKIEIWDKQKYQELFDNFSPEAFSQLAGRVMGGNQP